MERVLITGASGFVGYHLIEAALAANLEVYAAVRKSSDVTHLQQFDIKYTYPDFDNKEALKAEIETNRYDYVIHAAGITKATNQQDYDNINAGYTCNLALAASLSNHPVKKFVFISSLAALGPLNDKEGILDDDSMPQPVTAYGRSKLLAEQKLLMIENLPLIILRPTAVYGPRERDIFIVLKKISQGIEPYIGKVAQRLSFIYVVDLALLTVKALNSSPADKAFNICDGHVYDRYALAEYTKRILNKKTIRVHIPTSLIKFLAVFLEKLYAGRGKAPALNKEKLNELTAINWACSIVKAKAQLGFTTQYNLEQGLTETYTWYQKHKWL